jgi:hypothetical protein
MAISYEDFSNKLESIKKEYLESKSQELKTIEELHNFLLGKLFKKRTRGLKTLKGLNL